MSKLLSNEPNQGCDFCNNFAVAKCDAWIPAAKDVCWKKICHRCRHHFTGFDGCPNHSRAKSAVVTGVKQLGLEVSR